MDDAYAAEFPPCDEWTEVNIYSKLLRIIARVSGQVFVGSTLCRDDEYLECAVNYTLDLIRAQDAIQKVRPILRPFLAPRLPEVERVKRRSKETRDFIRPTVEARLAAEKKEGYQKPDDMLQWFMNR